LAKGGVDMNITPESITYLPILLLIVAIILGVIYPQLQKLSCESYCQQVATENYNKGYQAGESKGFNEGYTKGYKECEEIYKSKYSECLSLLNSTNLSLQNCTKGLEDCKRQLNKTVSLDVLLNEYKIYPKNITVKQLFIYFTITVGITFTLLEISIKVILKKHEKLKEILSGILLIVMIIIIVIVLIDIIVNVAYFLAS
jgi:hypothetical protein